MDTTSIIPDEIKDLGQKQPLSKFEYDLYHEEDDLTFPVVRVKRISTSNKVEKWKVMTDDKLVFVIEGSKLSRVEKEFLETIDGFNFILSRAKLGVKSFNGFKIELKKLLKSKSPKNKIAKKARKIKHK